MGQHYAQTTRLEGASTATTMTYQFSNNLSINIAGRITIFPNNFTFVIAKRPLSDGTHQLLRYVATKGVPFGEGVYPKGRGRQCYITDFTHDWRSELRDSDFEPPPGVTCVPKKGPSVANHR